MKTVLVNERKFRLLHE